MRLYISSNMHFQFRKTPLLIVYYSILYKEASDVFTN